MTESTGKIRGWVTGRLPDSWFTGAPEITVDREEITIVGRLTPPTVAEDASAAERAAAESGRIRKFREDTRDERIRIARELEHAAGRKVAWGAEAGDTRELFTMLSMPIMTRLRQSERQVLDTLVDAGVARSRSDALGWCVKLVAEHSEEWLGKLRDALRAVEEVRGEGPTGTSTAPTAGA